jgi:hypothetical protein
MQVWPATAMGRPHPALRSSSSAAGWGPSRSSVGELSGAEATDARLSPAREL